MTTDSPGLQTTGAPTQVTAPPPGPTQPAVSRSATALDNVPLGVEVVLGRTTKLFKELRDLQIGNPIELDRSPSQPVDVLVNGAPFAKGEIVVINDENLGVRITEILQSHEPRA